MARGVFIFNPGAHSQQLQCLQSEFPVARFSIPMIQTHFFFFCEPLDIFLTLTRPTANKAFCLPSCMCLHCLLPTEESVAALECGKTHVLHKHWRAAGGLGLVRWMGWMDSTQRHTVRTGTLFAYFLLEGIPGTHRL